MLYLRSSFCLLVLLVCQPLATIPLHASQITADFRDLGTFFTDELVLGDLTVRHQSPLGPLSVLQYNGLGSYESRLNQHFRLQIGDRVDFDFAAMGGISDFTIFMPVSSGPVFFGVQLEHYFLGNPTPTLVNYSGSGTINKIDFPDTSPIERVVLRVTGGNIRIGQITYTPAPEPASILLLTLAALAVPAGRRPPCLRRPKHDG